MGFSRGQFGFLRALVCRGKLPNVVVLVSLVALQDLSLQGQGGGGRDGGAESPGGSADRQDHCQRVFTFLPAQGKRSVRAAAPAGPADTAFAPSHLSASLSPAETQPPPPKNEPCAEAWSVPAAPGPHQHPRGGKPPRNASFQRISVFHTSTLCSPVITGISSFHTKTSPSFLIRSP